MSRIRRSFRRWLRSPLRVLELARAQRFFIDPARLFATYAGLRTYQPGDIFRLRHPDGAFIKTWHPVDVITTWVIFCGEEYQVLPQDKVILDIGANVGIFAMYAAMRALDAKIISFEPVADTYKSIEEQTSCTPFSERIACISKGIAGDVGTRHIFSGSGSDTSSLYRQTIPTVQGSETIEVTTLSEIFTSHQIDRVSLLKLDCEGAEWEVFDSTPVEIWDKIDRICLEYHLIDNRSPAELISILRSRSMRQTHSATRPNMTGTMWFSR